LDNTGREVSVDDTTVFVSGGEELPGSYLAQATWQADGIIFDLSVIGRDLEELEDEAVRIAESMIQ
jgi:hypothetical protein